MKVSRENLDQLAWEKQQGLIPAIIQDAITGVLLMQAYMNKEALIQTLKTDRVTFFSRTRHCLWEKGETSGNTLHCKEIVSDCDGDSLMVLASPTGPVCHTGAATCWEEGPQPGLSFLSELEGVIAFRQVASSESSYTAKLLKRGPKYIAQKVGEEAVETALAAVAGDDQEFLDESADLIYHLLVLINSKGLTLNDVVSVLKARHD
ncbi:MAG: bifunctional phosphoribosyl-AMP cyclohydrolase/phosphoribosyl-ATP diphosphatase HisIE [Candidatus Marinimicrobia bacterium]|nr:bifunctional phosphoribosyl-AMP cyclohydrolase/phosphoribosyl-ATP diphosphatase HisIE [Candidatus Neomarinimicrobiota bacterium]